QLLTEFDARVTAEAAAPSRAEEIGAPTPEPICEPQIPTAVSRPEAAWRRSSVPNSWLVAAGITGMVLGATAALWPRAARPAASRPVPPVVARATSVELPSLPADAGVAAPSALAASAPIAVERRTTRVRPGATAVVVVPMPPRAAAPPADRTNSGAVDAVADAPPSPPSPPPPGRLAVSVPFEVEIYEQGVIVGTSRLPIVLQEGRHELTLVNQTLNYRAVQDVDVLSRTETTLTAAIPTERLSLNALPWSEVLLDGRVIGETPLA